jgi:hypothetical protein
MFSRFIGYLGKLGQERACRISIASSQVGLYLFSDTLYR